MFYFVIYTSTNLSGFQVRNRKKTNKEPATYKKQNQD